MEQKKSIREWLKELPEEYRTKAQVNYEKQHIQLPYNAPELMVSSAKSALKGSFIWEDSPEKHDYWEKVFNELEG